MEVVAVTKYVRLSPTKARSTARLFRGMRAVDALSMARFQKTKAAFHIAKTLKSAIGNAEKNAKMAVDDLWICRLVIDDGPTLKRYQPRARGSAGPIRKRTCHVRVVLTDAKGRAVKKKMNAGGQAWVRK